MKIKDRVPKGRGAHRPGNAPLDFSEIVRRNAEEKVEAEMANALADTVQFPAVRLLALVDERVAELSELANVHVTVGRDFDDVECTWCTRGELISVRVIGQPRADDTENPLKKAEVCHPCAVSRRGPITQARVEQDPYSTLPIEVVVSE